MENSNLDTNSRKPAIVSVEMGYGHLRAAYPLVDLFDSPLIRADEPPIAAFDEQRHWRWVRDAHEGLSRLSQLPGRMGDLMRASMDSLTMIDPLNTKVDLSRPNLGVLALDFLIKRGLGRGLIEELQRSDRPLIATFYVPAVIADRARLKRAFCVVTDADIHRVWAPLKAEQTSVLYFAPSTRVVRRLRAYGVPKERILLTGFPLPIELLGGRDLKVARKNAAARLVRLDPDNQLRRIFQCEIDRLLGPIPEVESSRAPLLTFAVGGAGAQANIAAQFLPSLRDLIVRKRLRLALVAGIRRDVRMRFEEQIDKCDLSSRLGDGVQILFDTSFEAYYRRFNALLAETDVLWTKPSEISFYAALGIPLVLSEPLGAHERYNRRWLLGHGAALGQGNPKEAAQWLQQWFRNGSLACKAWCGFTRLPKLGTYIIEDKVRENL